MFFRLRHMLKKEFIQAFRDPRMRAVILLVPVIQTFLFGYAVTTDVRNVRVVIIDEDKSILSRMLINRFLATDCFKSTGSYDDYDYALEKINRGEADFALIIGRDFSRIFQSGSGFPVQMIVDGSNSMKAGTILGYVNAIFSGFKEKITSGENDYFRVKGKPVKMTERILFNPNLKSKNFYLPGVIAAMLMIITLMLSSMSVVREIEMGTIEQIMVTPISKFEFVAGKTIPFAIIGMIDVVLVTGVALLWFKIPFIGNPLLLIAANLLFLLSTLGVGLFISTICSSQQQAMLSTFFFVVPAMLLSGFVFPVSNMPVWIQYLTYLNPLRYMITILRGLFLKGVPFEAAWTNYAALGILGVLLLSVSVLKFRKTM